MCYPSDFENKIDFSAVRTAIAEFCSCQLGRDEVDKIQPFTDLHNLQPVLRLTQEMLAVVSDSSLAFPRLQIHDLRDCLSRVRIEGMYLDEDELADLQDVINTFLQVVSFVVSLDKERFPSLSCFTCEGDEGIAVLNKQLAAMLDRYGKLKDNASPELARIRRELQLSQGSVQRALNAILRQAQQDGYIERDITPTLREGRLVLPVSPAYKRKIGGIVHDESATGKTVYIEPQQVVEANNRIRELEGEEHRERIRILTAFANQLRPLLPAFTDIQNYLGKIDALVAKAMYARQINAIAPEIKNQPLISWKGARHPILQKRLEKQQKHIVPLDIELNDDKRILVISGPNAGGKSVCLKTVALLQYMLQCGILVPLEENSVAGMFSHIFIDIGDEQSIEDDLSTYSSHLKNMRYFLRNSDNHTLLLIDEFGGGTEPQIGGAIAQAVLQELAKQQCYGVITTHYENLKHLAQDTEGLVNGAMLYDRGRMQPLFQLSIGQPGSSFAIEIAKQIGLPEQIISEAREIAGDERIDYDKHLQDIARDKHYWEKKRQQVKEQQKKLEDRMAYYEEQLSEIKQKRRDMLQQAKTEAATLLEKSNAVIENTIRQIKESAADKEQTKSARQQLEDFKSQVNKPVKQPKKQHKEIQRKAVGHSVNTAAKQPIVVGCRVRKHGADMIGEVLSMTDKQALVAFGNIQSYVALKELEYVSAKQAKQKQQIKVTQSSNVSDAVHRKQMTFQQQLDLRGMRADEAYNELVNYIDDAIMLQAGEVRILHGTGTGALRQIVRNYLQLQHRIHSFHDAHPDEGGAGITIVEI